MSITDPYPSYSITDAASDWTASGAVFETKTDAVARMEGDQKTYASAKWADKVSYSLEEVRQILTGNLDIPGPLIIDGNVTLSAGSAVLSVGNGTGTPQIDINKSDAGNDAAIRLRMLGDNVWVFRHSASESLGFERWNPAGTFADVPLSIDQADGSVSIANTVTMSGALNHDGTTIGLYGATPVAQSTGWSATNVTPDKVFDADSTSVDELADVLGTLITYLISRGDLAA